MLGLFDQQEGKLSIARVSGETIPDWEVGATFEAGKEAHEALVSGHSGIVAGADSPEALAERFPGWQFIAAGGFLSIVAAPLVFGNDVVGALMACSATGGAFEDRHLALARHVASLVAGTVAASRLQASYGRRPTRRRHLGGSEPLSPVR